MLVLGNISEHTTFGVKSQGHRVNECKKHIFGSGQLNNAARATKFLQEVETPLGQQLDI
jgi:hypothetical protein